MTTRDAPRGTVLITGVGRRRSIGAGIAHGLAADGWDLALHHWWPYDERVGLDGTPDDVAGVARECRDWGVAVEVLSSDLADPQACADLIAAAGAGRSPLAGLVLSHCESVDSSILDTTVESFDRHFAVNARASWLLIKHFADVLPVREPDGTVAGRIVALTSDHTTHNLPYGASKGALDRIVGAAARELADRGVRANVINPGPVDTGWMDGPTRQAALAATPAGRLGTAEDVSRLVRFLLTEAGEWINGQLLYSDGGFGSRLG